MHVALILRPLPFLEQSQELLLCIEFSSICVTARGESTANKSLVMTHLRARFIHLIALRFPGVKVLQHFQKTLK